MFEEIMNLARQYGQSAVVSNKEVPDEHNEAVMQEASNSISSQLQNLAQSGDTNALQSMLNGNMSEPAAQNAQNNFIESITQKFGINGATAQNIATSLLPTILASIGKKTGASGADFNAASILDSLKGGNLNLDSLSKIGAKMGLDKDGDGDVDFSDITKMIR